MRKYIVLSLLILTPTFAPAMKRNSQTPNESRLILDLRKNVSNFENQLQFKAIDFDKQIIPKRSYETSGRTLFSLLKGSIGLHDIKFLKYCYYQKFEKPLDMLMKFDELKESDLFTACQNAQANGYSALGAVMIAKDMPMKKKREITQRLVNEGFEPTEKDIELANLYLYDSITIDQKAAIYYSLHALSHINWIELPTEIKEYIAQLIIQLFKKEDSWLLPEKTEPTHWGCGEIG